MSTLATQSRAERAGAAGFTAYLLALVALPLLALLHAAFAQGLPAFVAALSSPVARAALLLSIWTGLLVAALNAVFGTLTAWVLVRIRFPGRAALRTLIDLPFALPTLVAGLTIASLYGTDSWVGAQLAQHGVPIVFARPGIVLALLFVTLPFVIRAVEPVLLEIDPAEEEAARVLGAGPLRTFATVHLPALAPAAVSGAIRSYGRAIGEFGAIAIVAGNIPLRTLVAPVYIFGELESGLPHSAAALSVVMLAIALLLHGLARAVEARVGARRA